MLKGVPCQRASVSRRKAAVSLTLICALIVISGLIYSPWHRHNLASRQACLFSPVEACPTLAPNSPIQIQPVLSPVWILAIQAAALPLVHIRHPRLGRAPPA